MVLLLSERKLDGIRLYKYGIKIRNVNPSAARCLSTLERAKESASGAVV